MCFSVRDDNEDAVSIGSKRKHKHSDNSETRGTSRSKQIIIILCVHAIAIFSYSAVGHYGNSIRRNSASLHVDSVWTGRWTILDRK